MTPAGFGRRSQVVALWPDRDDNRAVTAIRTSALAIGAVGLLAVTPGLAATGLAGTWVATSPSGKVVLKLHGSGKSYRGTYRAGGKISRVSLELSNADGAGQVTLTFTATHRSTLCGLVSHRLMCAADTGTLAFARR
jgi:hypothetical protein